MDTFFVSWATLKDVLCVGGSTASLNKGVVSKQQVGAMTTPDNRQQQQNVYLMEMFSGAVV